MDKVRGSFADRLKLLMEFDQLKTARNKSTVICMEGSCWMELLGTTLVYAQRDCNLSTTLPAQRMTGSCRSGRGSRHWRQSSTISSMANLTEDPVGQLEDMAPDDAAMNAPMDQAGHSFLLGNEHAKTPRGRARRRQRRETWTGANVTSVRPGDLIAPFDRFVTNEKSRLSPSSALVAPFICQSRFLEEAFVAAGRQSTL